MTQKKKIPTRAKLKHPAPEPSGATITPPIPHTTLLAQDPRPPMTGNPNPPAIDVTAARIYGDKEMAKKPRWFAHPQGDVLQDGHNTLVPGAEVEREKISSDVLDAWLREGLIIPEGIFKLYFGEEWNRYHPTETVEVPDIPKLADEVLDDQGAPQIVESGLGK